MSERDRIVEQVVKEVRSCKDGIPVWSVALGFGVDATARRCAEIVRDKFAFTDSNGDERCDSCGVLWGSGNEVDCEACACLEAILRAFEVEP